MNISQRCMMIRKDSLHDAILLLTKVDVEVFGSYIEVVLVAFSEVKAMSIDWLPIILSTTDLRLLWRDRCYTPLGLLLSTEERVSLGIYEHSRSPVAHFTIVTDRDDVMLIMEANYGQTVDWVLMAILRQATFLDRL